MDRVHANEFPLTCPSEQESMTYDDASEVLTWVKKQDHVAITSYIEDKWKLYRASAMKEPSKPEKVFYAEWIRDSYYFHLKEFKKSPENGTEVQDKLMLFFGISGVSSVLFTDVCNFANSLKDHQVLPFFDYVDCAFKRELESVPKYLRNDPQGLRSSWLSEKGSEIMQKFLRSTEVLWKPAVHPDDVKSPEMQTEARRLLVLAQKRDMNGFASFLEKCSACLRQAGAVCEKEVFYRPVSFRISS